MQRRRPLSPLRSRRLQCARALRLVAAANEGIAEMDRNFERRHLVPGTVEETKQSLERFNGTRCVPHFEI